MKKFLALFMGLIFIYFCWSMYGYKNSGTAISAISYKWGSRGTVVSEIQKRLKNWGYYNGSIDSIYGYQTYIAVKKFQEKNGLNVDGVVGNDTLAALGINADSGKTQNSSYSGSKDISLLARAVEGESRGEPYIGQVAVAAVILNRTRDPRFPQTVAGVIYQPGAFTAVTDGQINLAPGTSATKAAQDAFNGWDPSGGAIYYYNPAKTTNKWIWSRPVIKVIGQHYFCK